jgi:hypothetical protein
MTVRFWKLVLLTSTFALVVSGLQEKNARANPLLLAAPPAVIGTLEVMAAAVAVAASVGIISVSENESFQRLIQSDIEKIKTETQEAIDYTVNGALVLYNKVAEKAGGALQCSEKNSDSARKESCSASIDACCENFLSKFSNRATRSRGAILFKRGKQKIECCMEWDYRHGGLEIFDKWGNHMGERGCDDLSEDPCEWTKSRGKHAEPSSANHSPRSPACRP